MDEVSPRSALSSQVAVLSLKMRARECSHKTGLYRSQFWSELFQSSLDSRHQGDDLLFYVTNSTSATEEGFSDLGPGFFVRRKGVSGASLPRIGSDDVDWESTFFLNAICNFEFKLVVSARGASDPSVVLEKCAVPVFASPHLVAAHESKETQRCSFPLLSFQVHDYATVGGVTMCPDRTLGVELLARGHMFGEKCQARVFSGALSWDQVREGFARHQPGGWWSKPGESHVALKGPGGKGEASLAILESEMVGNKGWFASWKRKEVSSLKCMVSHVSIHFRDIADVFVG